jgi:hypothetical protein
VRLPFALRCQDLRKQGHIEQALLNRDMYWDPDHNLFGQNNQAAVGDRQR